MSGFLCSMVGVSPAVAAGRTARTVTTVGNAQVSTAQSKFGGASALFDGTGDYLNISPFTNIAPGTSDFTFEAWIRLPNDNVDYGIFGHDGFNGDFMIRRVNDGTVRLGRDDVAWDLTSSAVTIANTWAHIAVCRTSTTAKIFVNGTQVASASNSQNYVLTNVFRIGSGANMGASDFNGYMDEIRISNIGRYTANFTPSTTPFTNDVNTLLLLHCNNINGGTTFVDDIGTNLIPRTPSTITASGNAKISTAQSKFGGSSILLDGTDDYLTIAQTDNFNFGTTGNFTIEFWIYFTSWTAPREVSVWEGRTPSGSNGSELIFLYTATTLGWYVYKNSGTRTSTGVPYMTANTWQHVALVRNGTNLQIYIDGTARGTPSTTDSFNYSHASHILIGVDTDINRDGNGYIDEYRVSNVARYTGNFTPSGSAFVNDSNTVLLIHADGTNNATTFTDDNFIRPTSLVAINGAALDTSQSKFGGSSLLCSSSTNPQIIFDNLVCNAVGTNPFTVELFFRTTNLTQSNKVLFFTNQGGSGRRGIQITNQTVRYTVDGTDVITTGNYLTSGTWHHIALVRGTNNTTNLYIDGTSRGSYASDTSSFAATNNSRIAGLANGFTPDGHMDELRISKTARYTATFTPTTAAFVNDANTTLLLHFDGTNGSTTFTDDNT